MAKLPGLREIVIGIIAVALALGIHFVIMIFEVKPDVEYLYILLGEMFLFLFILFSAVSETQDSVQNHNIFIKKFLHDNHQLFENVQKNLQRDIDYHKGESQIIKFLAEMRNLSIGAFYAMWCIDYEQQLDEYFEAEKDMERRHVKRYRLINKDVLKDKDNIKEHLRNNIDAIIHGNYKVYSTSHIGFEIIICFKAINQNDAIAIQLFKDTTDARVELAVHSYEKNFVWNMLNMFKALIGVQFMIKDNNPDNFDTSFMEWLNAIPPSIDYSKTGSKIYT